MDVLHYTHSAEIERWYFMSYFIDMWQRIFQFEGHASRPAYWWPVLIGGLLGGVISLIFSELIVDIYTVALTIATFTLTCRRLRDAGFQWWWALFRFAETIPVLSLLSLVPFVMCFFPSRGPKYIDAE